MTNELSDQQFKDRLQAAILLRQQGYYDAARQVAMDLVKIRPLESSVWHTLGQIWTAIGEFDAAYSSHAEAYRLIREHGVPSTHLEAFQNCAMGYAQAAMRFGRFRDAWPLWDLGRLNVSWAPWPGSQLWKPDSGGGSYESLLIQAEGGYGDIFMMLRWLPLLKQRWRIDRLGLTVFAGLESFTDWQSLGVDQVYVLKRDRIPFDWQYSQSILSLPGCFRVERWADIQQPCTIPVPRMPREVGAPRIGFCWRAEENTSPLRVKSLSYETANEIAEHLLKLRGDDTAVFSLSPERADLYSSETFRQPPPLNYEPHRMRDWNATAAYIGSMDFVLTVDTAVAHLSGLLGVPALVLLPKASCWRWSVPGEPCHWYKSLNLYRQPEALEWDAEEIAEQTSEILFAIQADAQADAMEADS